jgi:DNA repair exonuclease SbcCD ATPase subunit
MTKTKLQQELKEKVKPGIKPSQLKRSKSAESIPLPPPPPLTKSKSAENIPLQPSLSEQVKQLKQDLVFSQNTAQNYLQRLQKLEPELDNLKEELKALQATNTQLVDKNNELRLQALKDFDQHRENQQGLEQAVEKLVNTEQTQINYQVQNSILLREKKDLEKRLQTANERIQKLYQLKGLPNNAQAPFIRH